MNHTEFSKLDLKEKGAIVFSLGEFISSIIYYNSNVSLYLVDDMYVEVFYSIFGNKIDEISVLDPKERRLQLYAVNVNIQDLFK